MLWHDPFHDMTAPDISLLEVIKSLMRNSSEPIEIVDVSLSVLLPPVSRQLQLSLLDICSFEKAVVGYYEGHVAAPFSIGSKTFLMGFHDCSARSLGRHEFRRELASHCNVILARERCSSVYFVVLVCVVPPTHL